MAVFPGTVDNYFDAMALWEDGTLVLGASCLAGKYWGGSVWVFNDIAVIPSMEKCVTGVETEAGVSDLISIGEGKVMLGLDSGSVEIMHLETNPALLNTVFYACEHDNLVSSINILSDKTKVVSSSYDHNIKVWDLEALCSCLTIRAAHGDAILQIAPSQSTPYLFLSCSKDRRLRLWDLREANKPCIVSTILGAKSVMPTSVACHPNSSLYAVGNEIGEIHIGDFRKNYPGEESSLTPTLGKASPHNRKIRKMKFSADKPDWLASCSDSTEVAVTCLSSSGELSLLWKDSTSHKNFVRDVLWDSSQKGKLLSCGWDSAVLPHQISDSIMDTQ